MPVHHLLEEILNEYIAAAGLQSGQPLFQSLNSLGTEVTGRALNRYNAWAAIRKRAKAAGFLTLSDVTPGGQLAHKVELLPRRHFRKPRQTCDGLGGIRSLWKL